MTHPKQDSPLEGWKIFIDAAVQRASDRNIEITQIKEKFGLLRIYFQPPDDATPGLIDSFQHMLESFESSSAYICEVCGAPGTRGNTRPSGGWIKTLCPTHLLKFQEHYK